MMSTRAFGFEADGMNFATLDRRGKAKVYSNPDE
jgi:hypothetical protein